MKVSKRKPVKIPEWLDKVSIFLTIASLIGWIFAMLYAAYKTWSWYSG